MSEHASWGVAARATLHCLTGCAVGEILGMAAATAWGWSNLPSVLLAVVAAFVCGYGMTLRGLRAVGLSQRQRLTLALAADTLSITTMEVVDNAVMLALPGVMAAGLGDLHFWLGLTVSLAVAFAAALPVNRWLLLRGRGHALVHHHHHHHEGGS